MRTLYTIRGLEKGEKRSPSWKGHHRLWEYLKLLPMAKLTISLNQLFSAARLSALANLFGDDGKLTTSMKNNQYVDKNLSEHPLIHLFYALWPKSKMQKTSKPEISWLSRPLEKTSMEIILPQCSCWLKCLEFLTIGAFPR